MGTPSNFLRFFMILPIVHYGHPVLRQKGAEIRSLSKSIQKLAKDMIETMHAANGVGLAAQQVGQALQLTVLDITGTDRPSQLFLGVREITLSSMMPLVLINPQITRKEGEEMGSEGCLSFPEIGGDILRAGTVHVSAIGLDSKPLQFTATGLLSRAIQHELDHLNGILFIDRMAAELRKTLDPEIKSIEKATISMLKKKGVLKKNS